MLYDLSFAIAPEINYDGSSKNHLYVHFAPFP